MIAEEIVLDSKGIPDNREDKYHDNSKKEGFEQLARISLNGESDISKRWELVDDIKKLECVNDLIEEESAHRASDVEHQVQE